MESCCLLIIPGLDGPAGEVEEGYVDGEDPVSLTSNHQLAMKIYIFAITWDKSFVEGVLLVALLRDQEAREVRATPTEHHLRRWWLTLWVGLQILLLSDSRSRDEEGACLKHLEQQALVGGRVEPHIVVHHQGLVTS